MLVYEVGRAVTCAGANITPGSWPAVILGERTGLA